MTAFPKLAALVTSVLKLEARYSGKTTKAGSAALVWKRLEKSGGPSAFGLGSSAMIMGCMYYINTELHRQLKANLTEHEIEYIPPTTIPKDLIKLMGRVPRWIAIEEGNDALWMYWRSATYEHWTANAQLKRRKAEQTLASARFSVDLADYMETHGIHTLGQIFRDK